MPQTAYNFLMTVGVAGELYDIGFNNVLSPVSPMEPMIFPGLGLAKSYRSRFASSITSSRHQASVVQSAPLSAGNSTTVTLEWRSFNACCIRNQQRCNNGALAALIAAQPFIASATFDGTSTINIQAEQGFPVTAVFVTSGGSAVTWTTNYSNDNVFYGISVYIQNKMNLYGPQGSAGAAPYIPGDAVATLTRGRIYVTAENNVTSDSPVYWRQIATMSNPILGSFRSDSDWWKRNTVAQYTSSLDH